MIMRKYVPVPPFRPKSPLITNPEKWNGRRRVLNVKSVAHLRGNSLTDSHYARALTSPLRVDRLSKVIQVPRDMLLTLSIKDRDGLWLLPNVTNEKSLSSNSYITNSYKVLSGLGKKWPQVASLEILANNHTLTGVKDIRWSSKSSDVVNTILLEKILELWELKDSEASKNDLVLAERGDFNVGVVKGVTEVSLNHLKVQNPLFDDLLKKVDRKPAVICRKNHQLIDYLMKFVAYNN